MMTDRHPVSAGTRRWRRALPACLLMLCAVWFLSGRAAQADFVQYSAAVQALNPVAYYHLSEADGAVSAADSASGGTAVDDGTYNGFVTQNYQAYSVWDMLGVEGGGDKAPAFDGTAASGGSGTYISVLPSADLIPLSSNPLSDPVVGDVSFSFFLYKQDASRRFIGGWRPTAGSFLNIEWTASGRLNLEGRGISTSNEVDLFSNPNLLPETLYHVVISLDVNEEDNTLSTGAIYVNGQDNTEVSTTVYRETGVVAGIDAFELATGTLDLGRWGGNGYYWNGMLDEFAIYDQALTAEQALALYQAAAPAPSTPGDFNADGNVDGADFVIWQTNFPNNTGTATLEMGDANGDGSVDGADFVVWQTNFPTTSGSITAVPEPSSLLILVLTAFGMATWQRRLIASRTSRNEQ